MNATRDGPQPSLNAASHAYRSNHYHRWARYQYQQIVMAAKLTKIDIRCVGEEHENKCNLGKDMQPKVRYR